MIRGILGWLCRGMAAVRALEPNAIAGLTTAIALAMAGLVGGGIALDRFALDGAIIGTDDDPGFLRSWWKGKRSGDKAPWDDEDWREGAGHAEAPRKAQRGTPASAEDIASIRRSGMVLRDGKWLPAELVPGPGGHRGLSRASGVGSAGDNVLVQLLITTGSLPEGTLSKAFNAQILATGGTPPYSWSTSGTLPLGLQFDTARGLFYGTPLQLFSDSLRVRVSDADSNSDEAEYLLVILPEDQLRIVTESLPDASVGNPLAIALAAAGGVPPYDWSVSGELPPGVSISSAGAISGNPTGEFKSYPLSVTVTDAQGTQASKDLVLKVVSRALRIVSAQQLDPAQQGKPAEIPLDAEGGTTPYRWELIAGEIPPGLTFADGVFSGTPETIGSFGPLSVAVWDATAPEPQIAYGDFYLEITEAPIGPVTDLRVYPSAGKAVLTWNNPDEPEFAETLVVRSTAAIPATPDEGDIVYQGVGTTTIDQALADGTTYHYAAFAFTPDGEYSALDATSYGSATILPFTKGRAAAGAADPHADAAYFTPLAGADRFNAASVPGIVLGPPNGLGYANGSKDVVSLGAAINGSGSAPYGGEIVVEFTDNVIVDGPGNDFTVFENAFYIGGDHLNRFMEPAVVYVSQDGSSWKRFPIDFSPRYDDAGNLNLQHPYCYGSGFAGINPVLPNADPTNPSESGGDSFDLATVGLAWARFVKIQSTGDNWIIDGNGDAVRHTNFTGAALRTAGNSGFDLDAVTAVNY
ncbi:MAG: hypothetical protein IT577_20975 [Verrucomicrobiae bacterium]|nr:hypothetical protein [Verrucomicrobiae bacterium]